MTHKVPLVRLTRMAECKVSEESVMTLSTRVSSKIMFTTAGAGILVAKESTGECSTRASDMAKESGLAQVAKHAKATGSMDR